MSNTPWLMPNLNLGFLCAQVKPDIYVTYPQVDSLLANKTMMSQGEC